MKKLSEYIYEAAGTTLLQDLTVKYNCPDELFIQTPEQMSESDVQIYLDDTLLNKLPAETGKSAFGKNAANVIDAYFEYESMDTAAGREQKSDIEWDSNYNPGLNGGNMHVLKIRGMKYVVVFDSFELKDVERGEIRKTLYGLFNGIIDNNKLPFAVSLNEDNIEWSNEK